MHTNFGQNLIGAMLQLRLYTYLLLAQFYYTNEQLSYIAAIFSLTHSVLGLGLMPRWPP